MAKKNRSTLKRYFREGAVPSSDQFGDLIDSSLNMIDEGFDRSATHGVEISLVGEHDKLISFFRNASETDAVWSVNYDKSQDKLFFLRPGPDEEEEAPLTLAPAAKVGVNNRDPKWNLDVAGVVAAEGRIGANPSGQQTVPANGEWHNIAGPFNGCQALEVMAGAGNKGTGKYALLKATALNTFNPRGWIFNFLNLKKRINVQQAYYLGRSTRLKLRWVGEGTEYFLQIRSNTSYGDGIHIRYYITKLWFDEDMSDSWVGTGGAAGD